MSPREHHRSKLTIPGRTIPRTFIALLLCVWSTAPATATGDSDSDAGVIPIAGSPCEAVCASLVDPALYTIHVECTRCLIGAKLLTNWNLNRTVIQRLPFQEAGLHFMPAVPLESLRLYSLTNPAMINNVYEVLYKNINRLEKNVSFVVNGTTETRDFGVTYGYMGEYPNLTPTFCYSEAGWFGVDLNPHCTFWNDRANPPFDDDFTKLVAAVPRTDGLPWADDFCLDRHLNHSIELSNKLITSARDAERYVWRMNQVLNWEAYLYVKLFKDDVPRLKRIYGEDNWKSEYDEFIEAGALYEYDLLYFESMQPSYEYPDQWQPAAHFLSIDPRLADSEADAELLPIVILLSNEKGDPSIRYVYTRNDSESAWLVALQILRVVLTSSGIYSGHLYTFHVPTGAASRSLFNKIDRELGPGESNHVLRQLIGPHIDPGIILEFNTFLFANDRKNSTLPPDGLSTSNFFRLNERFIKFGPLTQQLYSAAENVYWKNNNGFYNFTPHAILKRTKLNAEDWTSNGGSPWDLYPGVFKRLQIWEATENFTRSVIYEAYEGDDAILADKKLQAFAEDVIDPNGGNLPINEKNTLGTREDLVAFATHILYNVVVHSASRIAEFAYPRVTSPIVSPPVLGKWELPSPSKEFSLDEILDYVPHVFDHGQWSSFLLQFFATTPFTSMIPPINGTKELGPDFAANLPFTSDSLNEHVVEWRHDIADWYEAEDPTGGWIKYPPEAGPLCKGLSWAESNIEF